MRPTPGGQVVEIDDLAVGFGAAPKEGTLADLPRPEEQPDRKQPEGLGGAPQNLFVGSPKPHVWQYFTRLHFCQDPSITPHGTLKESDPSGPRTNDELGAGFVPLPGSHLPGHGATAADPVDAPCRSRGTRPARARKLESVNACDQPLD